MKIITNIDFKLSFKIYCDFIFIYKMSSTNVTRYKKKKQCSVRIRISQKKAMKTQKQFLLGACN